MDTKLGLKQETLLERWVRLVYRNDYRDILSTEEAIEGSLNNFDEFERKLRGLDESQEDGYR